MEIKKSIGIKLPNKIFHDIKLYLIEKRDPHGNEPLYNDVDTEEFITPLSSKVHALLNKRHIF